MTDLSGTAERVRCLVEDLPPKVRWAIAVDRKGALDVHAPLLLREAAAPDEPAYRAFVAIVAAGMRGRRMKLGEGLAAALGSIEQGNGRREEAAALVARVGGYVLTKPRFLAAPCYAKKISLPAEPLLRLLLDLSKGEFSRASRNSLLQTYRAMSRLRREYEGARSQAMKNAL